MINLELYRIFYTVAKCGSLTKASEELFISQPAVSHAIKQLENQLGGQLFVRTHNGMELSKTGGKQIFDYVEKAIKLLDEAENKYSEIKETAIGEVRICASDSVIIHFLLPYIKIYHEKYPQVKLTLRNRTSSETIDMLKSNKGDIGFINLPVEDDEIKLLNIVMTLHDSFVCSNKFNELLNKTVALERLQDYPLLMLEAKTTTTQSVASFAHNQGVQLNPEIEVASLELMTSLAKNGMGIASIPREFVRHELEEEKSLFEIKTEPQLPTRAIGLAVPKGASLSFAVKEFISLIEKK